MPDFHLVDGSGATQFFPLYLYEKDEPRDGELSLDKSEGELIDGYRRRHAITDGILAEFRKALGDERSELSVRPQKRDRLEQVQSLEIAVKLRSRTRILETQNFG